MMAAAQQLSPFDRRRLDEHLAVCEACSEFYRDMALLGGALAAAGTDAINVSHPIAAPRIVSPAASLPIDLPTPSSTTSGLRYRTWWGAVAAGIVCFAGGLAIARHTIHDNTPSPTTQVPAHTASLQQTPSVRTAPPSTNLVQPTPAEPSVSLEQEAGLQAEFARLRSEFESSQNELNALRQQYQDAGQKTQDLTADLTKLHQENTAQQELIRQIQFQLDQAHSSHALDTKLLAMRDDQIRELTTNLVASVSETADARKRNEASHLMEQRNLHVVDVYDNNTKGQRSAAFGRVFYSEGGPLLFVAFDLPNSGRSKVSYHAWGQTEGSSKNPLQLGTFALDDTVSQRWVLRVTDAQLLKQVDAVFITADHGTEVRTPSGAPLLYAYLHQVPNHP